MNKNKKEIKNLMEELNSDENTICNLCGKRNCFNIAATTSFYKTYKGRKLYINIGYSLDRSSMLFDKKHISAGICNECQRNLHFKEMIHGLKHPVRFLVNQLIKLVFSKKEKE